MAPTLPEPAAVANTGHKGEGLGKYEFPRPSTTGTEVPVDALTEVSA
jgi:hypothetical protein